MEYFISRDSKVSGPFSKQQVLAGIKSKKLRKTDLVGTSANGPWQTVQDAVGTKTPKASTAKKPVESEAQNKQGNASAEEYDDFWDDLPDPPAASSSPVAPTLSNYHLAKAEAELKKRKVEEAAEQSLQRMQRKLVIGIGVGGGLTCLLCVLLFVFWAENQKLLPPVSNSIGIELRHVPFSNADENERQEWHEEIGTYELDKRRNESGDFFLSSHEITRSQFKKVMPDIELYPRFEENANIPVEVGWELAEEFCFTLSELPKEKADGRWYRLPTEAEWRYAAYANGNGRGADVDRMAWHSGNSGKKLHPVGTKDANAWGFHDVLGNVWEWVQNRATKEDPFFQTSDKTDPAFYFQFEKAERVVMGGSSTGLMYFNKWELPLWELPFHFGQQDFGNQVLRRKNSRDPENGAGFRIVMVERTGGNPRIEKRDVFETRKAKRKKKQDEELARKTERERVDKQIEKNKKENEFIIKLYNAARKMKDVRMMPVEIWKIKKLVEDLKDSVQNNDPSSVSTSRMLDTLQGLEKKRLKMEADLAQWVEELPQKISENKKLLQEASEYNREKMDDYPIRLENEIQKAEVAIAEKSNPSSLDSRAETLLNRVHDLRSEYESLARRDRLGAATYKKQDELEHAIFLLKAVEDKMTPSQKEAFRNKKIRRSNDALRNELRRRGPLQ